MPFVTPPKDEILGNSLMVMVHGRRNGWTAPAIDRLKSEALADKLIAKSYLLSPTPLLKWEW